MFKVFVFFSFTLGLFSSCAHKSSKAYHKITEEERQLFLQKKDEERLFDIRKEKEKEYKRSVTSRSLGLSDKKIEEGYKNWNARKKAKKKKTTNPTSSGLNPDGTHFTDPLHHGGEKSSRDQGVAPSWKALEHNFPL